MDVERPQPGQTTITGQSSAAFRCADSPDGKPIDRRRTEEIVGPDEEAVGGEEEGRIEVNLLPQQGVEKFGTFVRNFVT